MTLVLDVDRELAAHLAVALASHRRRLRSEGLPPPAGFDDLVAVATKRARAGQGQTDPDDVLAWLQDAPVERLLLTKAEAAKVLGIHERTVQRLVAAGELPAVHVRGATRIRKADLDAYVSGLDPNKVAS